LVDRLSKLQPKLVVMESDRRSATAGSVRAERDLLQSGAQAVYEWFRARGKREKVALVAAMHRIIVILNAVLKSNTTWRQPCAAVLEKNRKAAPVSFSHSCYADWFQRPSTDLQSAFGPFTFLLTGDHLVTYH
jgi:hypothetical protein